MGRYDRLAELLAAREGDVWEVGFEELEGLLGLKLSVSAYKYPT